MTTEREQVEGEPVTPRVVRLGEDFSPFENGTLHKGKNLVSLPFQLDGIGIGSVLLNSANDSITVHVEDGIKVLQQIADGYSLSHPLNEMHEIWPEVKYDYPESVDRDLQVVIKVGEVQLVSKNENADEEYDSEGDKDKTGSAWFGGVWETQDGQTIGLFVPTSALPDITMRFERVQAQTS